MSKSSRGGAGGGGGEVKRNEAPNSLERGSRGDSRALDQP